MDSAESVHPGVEEGETPYGAAYAARQQYRTAETPVASNSSDGGNGKFTERNYWYALNLGKRRLKNRSCSFMFLNMRERSP